MTVSFFSKTVIGARLDPDGGGAACIAAAFAWLRAGSTVDDGVGVGIVAALAIGDGETAAVMPGDTGEAEPTLSGSTRPAEEDKDDVVASVPAGVLRA